MMNGYKIDDQNKLYYLTINRLKPKLEIDMFESV